MSYYDIRSFLLYWIGCFSRNVFYSGKLPIPSHLVQSLSVENLDLESGGLDKNGVAAVIAFRHLRGDSRLRIAEKALREYDSIHDKDATVVRKSSAVLLEEAEGLMSESLEILKKMRQRCRCCELIERCGSCQKTTEHEFRISEFLDGCSRISRVGSASDYHRTRRAPR